MLVRILDALQQPGYFCDAEPALLALCATHADLGVTVQYLQRCNHNLNLVTAAAPLGQLLTRFGAQGLSALAVRTVERNNNNTLAG